VPPGRRSVRSHKFVATLRQLYFYLLKSVHDQILRVSKNSCIKSIIEVGGQPVRRIAKEGRVGGKRWMEEVGILRTGGQIAQRRLEKVGDGG
jgi:hypothetical protein